MELTFTLKYFAILMLSIIALTVTAVKVAIKSHNGNWCIRVNESRVVVVDQCYWTLTAIERKKRKLDEQTFDVHPADVNQEEVKPDVAEKSSSFLIRLSTKGKSSSVTVPGCLTSISMSLTIEKCFLRKSRFQFSGIFLTTSYTDSCLLRSSPADYRYLIQASDNSCLHLGKSTRPMYNYTLAFSKCMGQSQQLNSPYWQLCTPTGNCSLSPSEFNWNSLIRTEPHPLNQAGNTNCAETTPTPNILDEHDENLNGTSTTYSPDMSTTETNIPITEVEVTSANSEQSAGTFLESGYHVVVIYSICTFYFMRYIEGEAV